MNCCGHSGVYHRFVPGMQWPCWLSARNPIWWPATSETKSLGTDLWPKMPRTNPPKARWLADDDVHWKKCLGLCSPMLVPSLKVAIEIFHVASSRTIASSLSTPCCGQVHRLNLRSPDLACSRFFLLILSNFYVGFLVISKNIPEMG